MFYISCSRFYVLSVLFRVFSQCFVIACYLLLFVVGGHVDVPIFGVPTSVGYGANFGGVSALLSMLNSCAANVAVVNIDAGFKAAYLAGMVACAAQST